MGFIGPSFTEIVGKTVKSYEFNADFVKIVDTDGNKHLWIPEGDCCSRSWFEHSEGLELLVGREVLGVGEMEMPVPDNTDDYHEYIRVYGWTLRTEAGVAEIEMRNSSNGYYGGYVEYRCGR